MKGIIRQDSAWKEVEPLLQEGSRFHAISCLRDYGYSYQEARTYVNTWALYAGRPTMIR